MNRRDFLTRAVVAATALAIDPEELLWKPTKTIFLPLTQRTLTATVSEYSDFITVSAYYQKMALEQLQKKLIFSERADNETLRQDQTIEWFRYALNG